ncbi:MAG: hypothetical protein IPG71_00360 [bacterium]|nr:hypothetical protein [bacterium]
MPCHVVPHDAPFGPTEKIMSQYLAAYRQLSVETIRMGEYVQYTYTVRLRDESELHAFILHLSTIEEWSE